MTAAFLLALGMTFITSWMLRSQLQSWWGAFEALIRSSGEPGAEALAPERIAQACKGVFKLLLIPVAVSAAVVLLTGFLQTKFLVKADLATFKGERLFANSVFENIPGRLMGSASAAFLWIVMGAGFGLFCASLGLGLTRIDVTAFSRLSETVLKAIFLTVGPLALAAGLAAIVLEQVQFRRRHRMTRRELEAEGGRE